MGLNCDQGYIMTKGVVRDVLMRFMINTLACMNPFGFHGWKAKFFFRRDLWETSRMIIDFVAFFDINLLHFVKNSKNCTELLLHDRFSRSFIGPQETFFRLNRKLQSLEKISAQPTKR